MARDASRPLAEQYVISTGGFAYGAIGADIHVFANGQPLYLLANWQPAENSDREWLRALPSRMLNAQRAVVPFTGRHSELGQIESWRDSQARFGVRWLHGPSGQGKTRLAAEIAARSATAGWKVVAASHGPDADSIDSRSQDMSVAGHEGLLLIVDYADRWLMSNMTWLFKNNLLHDPGVATRVLMVARTAHPWPAICALLDPHRAETSIQPLEPLSDESGERTAMFDIARDTFASLCDVADSSAITVPTTLAGREFGLTLAIHMAALVAVDALATGERPPSGIADLTIYLLNREQLHWRRLFQEGAKAAEADATYRTPPEVMNRAVFIAALTGTLSRAEGKAVLDSLNLKSPEQILADHSVCYPPAAASATVLEPIYPDRLAEDFVALTLPGHPTGYPAQAWAPDMVTALLGHHGEGQARPSWTSRTVTLLASAADRWEHVASDYVYPALLNDPQLALDVGNAALTAISSITGAPGHVLEAIETRLPDDRDVDLDPAIAVLTSRITHNRLEQTDDAAERAKLHGLLGWRLGNAGMYLRAVDETRKALLIRRRLAEADQGAHQAKLAASLGDMGVWLAAEGHLEEAVASSAEAAEIERRLAAANPADHVSCVATQLSNLSSFLGQLGQRDEALAKAREAVGVARRLAPGDLASHRRTLGRSLANLGNRLVDLGQWAEAAAVVQEASDVWALLIRSYPESLNVVEPEIAATATNLSRVHSQGGNWQRAVPAAELAVDMYRRLAEVNPDAFESGLATSLAGQGQALFQAGQWRDALASNHEVAAIYRRLAEAQPSLHRPGLAKALVNLGSTFWRTGQQADAIACTREAVDILASLATVKPRVYEGDYAMALGNLGLYLSETDRGDEAIQTLQQAVGLRRRRVDVNRANPADLAALAEQLSNLAAELSKAGRPREALDIAREAAKINEKLARKNPAVYRPAMAASLANLGAVSVAAGQWIDALLASQLAVSTYRPLANANPEHEFGLAKALTNLGAAWGVIGRNRRALAVTREAVQLFTRVETRSPGGADRELRNALDLGATVLAYSRQPAKAESLRRMLAAGELADATALLLEGR